MLFENSERLPAYAREDRRAGPRSGQHPIGGHFQEVVPLDCPDDGAAKEQAKQLVNASEWRLTWWTCDVTGELPSKKFMSWGREKQNAVSKYPVAVSSEPACSMEQRKNSLTVL
jgi:hypothetical protein